MQHLSGKRSNHSGERSKFKIDVANLRIDLAILEKKPEAGAAILAGRPVEIRSEAAAEHTPAEDNPHPRTRTLHALQELLGGS